MHEIIETNREALAAICRRYGVARLEAFGSVTDDRFDPQRSDIDFLVDFDPDGEPNLFHRYFGLKEDLESLLGRAVDLVMLGALRNPYFIDSVNKTRQPVYAASLSQAA
jgi:predicted nucleotidyltransferase